MGNLWSCSIWKGISWGSVSWYYHKISWSNVRFNNLLQHVCKTTEYVLVVSNKKCHNFLPKADYPYNDTKLPQMWYTVFKFIVIISCFFLFFFFSLITREWWIFSASKNIVKEFYHSLFSISVSYRTVSDMKTFSYLALVIACH